MVLPEDDVKPSSVQQTTPDGLSPRRSPRILNSQTNKKEKKKEILEELKNIRTTRISPTKDISSPKETSPSKEISPPPKRVSINTIDLVDEESDDETTLTPPPKAKKHVLSEDDDDFELPKPKEIPSKLTGKPNIFLEKKSFMVQTKITDILPPASQRTKSKKKK